MACFKSYTIIAFLTLWKSWLDVEKSEWNKILNKQAFVRMTENQFTVILLIKNVINLNNLQVEFKFELKTPYSKAYLRPFNYLL